MFVLYDMKKKAKHTLFLEDDFDFDMIGICCHQNDYRIAWVLNEALSIMLAKSQEPFMVSNKKGDVVSSHSYYQWEDEENGVTFNLVKNKAQKDWLVPEKHQIDFFLVIKNGGIVDVDDLLTKIKSIPNILTAIIVAPNELKSKSNLIF